MAVSNSAIEDDYQYQQRFECKALQNIGLQSCSTERRYFGSAFGEDLRDRPELDLFIK